MRSMFTALAATLSVATAVPAMAQLKGYQEIAVTDGGRIAGRVTMKGNAPARERLDITKDKAVCGKTEKFAETLVVSANGGVANAVVYLRAMAKGKPWLPHEELVQEDCRFRPHVLLVPQGGDLRVVNTDRIGHHVRAAGPHIRLNVIQPRYVEKLLVPALAKEGLPETVSEVWCDIHPWMHAHIVVEQHPYYAVTCEDGSFRLTGVPPWQYDLAIWHERLGDATRRVTVDPNGETSVSFEMELGDRPAPSRPGRRGRPL